MTYRRITRKFSQIGRVFLFLTLKNPSVGQWKKQHKLFPASISNHNSYRLDVIGHAGATLAFFTQIDNSIVFVKSH
jgi:hypothetical protein